MVMRAKVGGFFLPRVGLRCELVDDVRASIMLVQGVALVFASLSSRWAETERMGGARWG